MSLDYESCLGKWGNIIGQKAFSFHNRVEVSTNRKLLQFFLISLGKSNFPLFFFCLNKPFLSLPPYIYIASKELENTTAASALATARADIRMEELPLGFRFYPTEEELVSFYLHNKLEGTRQELHRVIPVINIYDTEPWHLPRTKFFALTLVIFC